MAEPTERSGLRRVLRGLAFTVWTLVLTTVGVEVGLRVLAGQQVGYYVHQELDGLRRYPFGDIPVNDDGWPDDPFDPDEPRPRVGYMGDSVVYGLGVPYGERFTEVLDELRPDLDHRNYGKPGWNGNRKRQMSQASTRSRDDGLTHVVYMVNLNDIRIDGAKAYSVERPAWLAALSAWEGYSAIIDFVLQRWEAQSATGQTMLWFPQFHPSRMHQAVEETARRIRGLSSGLARQGIGFTAVILPVEMQVSADAERTYAELGVEWEEGFVPHGAQDALLAELDGVDALSALEAFTGPDVEAGRQRIAYCELFVCDRGGRLDWNHPNPEGHRLLGEFLAERVLARAVPPVSP